MEKIKVVAKKLQKSERILSGLLRIQNVLQTPEKYFDKVDTVGGWLKSSRKQNNDKLVFWSISDGSCQTNL